MKKLIKTLSILMMSAIMILPTAISTQAEEVNNNTNETVEYNTNKTNSSTYSIPSGFTKRATINANNVNLRNGSWVSLGQLHKGDVIYLDNTGVYVINGYPCKRCYSVRHGLIGYVYINYIDE